MASKERGTTSSESSILKKPSWRSTFSTVLHLEAENDLDDERDSDRNMRNADNLDASTILGSSSSTSAKLLSKEDLIGLSRVRTMPLSALLADMPQSIHNKIISTSLLSAQTKLQRQRKVEEYVFGCIHARFVIRHFALKLADSSIFEAMVTIVVFCNAVIFGLADPLKGLEHWGNRVIYNSEDFFSYFYAIEACLKIFAFGFGFDRMLEYYFGKGLCEKRAAPRGGSSSSTTSTTSDRNTSSSPSSPSSSTTSSSSSSLNINKSFLPAWLKSTTDSGYFANAWNQLDFIVAVLGIIQLHSSSLSTSFVANLTGVRTLRLLRPLRSIMMLDGARIILEAIRTSLRGFLDVFLLVVLSCFAFALVAVELWRGNMKGHCGYLDTGKSSPSSFVFLGIDSFLQKPIGCGLPCADIPYGQPCNYGRNGGGDLCPVLIAPFVNTSSSSSSLFYNWTETSCRNTDAFASAEVNYDNVLYGMLNAFTFITTEGWSQAMYAVWHHFGYPELVSTIFVIHVFFGSAFVLELALAVLWERYTAVSLADEDRENAFHMLIVRRLGFDEEALEITRKAAKRAVDYLDGPLCDSKECKEAIKLATYASSKAPLRDHIQQEAKEFIFGDPNDAVFQEEQEKELLGGRRLSQVVDLKFIRQELVVYATDVARAAQLDQDVATAIHTLRNQPLMLFENDNKSSSKGIDGFLDKLKGFGYAAESKFLFLSKWSNIKQSPPDENKEKKQREEEGEEGGGGGRGRSNPSSFVSPKSLQRSPNFKDANSADSKQNPLAAEMRAFAEKKKLKGFVNDKMRRQLALQKKALVVFAVRNAGVLKGSKSFGPSAVEVVKVANGEALSRQLKEVENGKLNLTISLDDEKVQALSTLSDRSPSPLLPHDAKSTSSSDSTSNISHNSQKTILRSTSNIRGASKLLRVGTKKFASSELNISSSKRSTTKSLSSSARSIPAEGGGEEVVIGNTTNPGESSSPPNDKDSNIKRSLSILHQTEDVKEVTMKDVAKMRNVFIPWKTTVILPVPKLCQRFAFCCCGCGCSPDSTFDNSDDASTSGSNQDYHQRKHQQHQHQSEYQFEEAQFEVDVESDAHKARVRNGVFNRCCCRGEQTHIYFRQPPSVDELFRYVASGVYDVYMSITPSFPSWLSRPAHFLVDHWIFKLISMACVFANIVVLGLVYHGMSAEFANGLELCNFVFVCIFAVELFLKLIGFGPMLLFSDIYNVFDAIIVILSIVDATVVTNTALANVTPLRVLRIARVFKLLRTWRNLRVLMGALAIGLGKAVNAFMLLFFIIYLFAVVGMQIFGPHYETHAKETGEPIPFSNFQSLFWSLITIFQVMDNENWDAVVNYHKSVFGLPSVFFFLLVFVIGNFIFLNLFITILMTVLQTPPSELIDSIENGLEHDLELSHNDMDDKNDEEEDDEEIENFMSGGNSSSIRKSDSLRKSDKLDMHAFDPEKDIPDIHSPRTPEHSFKLGVAEIVDAKGKKPNSDTRTKNKPKLFRSDSARFLPAVSKFRRFMRIRAIRAAMQSCPFCINHASVHAASPKSPSPTNTTTNRSPSPSLPGSRTPVVNKSVDGDASTTAAAAPVVKSALKDPQSSRIAAASLPSPKDFEKSAVDKHGRLVPQAAASKNFQSDSITSLRTTSTQSVPSQDVPSDPSQTALLALSPTDTPDAAGGGVGNILNKASPQQGVSSSTSLSTSLQSIDHLSHSGVSTSEHHPSKNFHKEASRLVMVKQQQTLTPQSSLISPEKDDKGEGGEGENTKQNAATPPAVLERKSSKFAGTKSKFVYLDDSPKITKPVINVVTSDSGVAQSVEIFIPASKISTDDVDSYNPQMPYSLTDGEHSEALIETEPIRIIISSDGVIRIILASETEKKAMLAEAHKQRKIKRLQNLRSSCCFFPQPGSTISALLPCFAAARSARDEAVTQINRLESFRAWVRRRGGAIFSSSNKVSPAPLHSDDSNVNASGRITSSSSSSSHNKQHDNVDTLDWIVDKAADFIAFPVSSELDDDALFPTVINLGCFKLSRRSKWRRPFLYVYKWFWFDLITIVTTFIACINLALDSPSLRDCSTSSSSCGSLLSYLEVSEIFCVIIFVLEVIVISMARGLIDKPYSSLRNGWYQLDIITIATSIAALAYGYDSQNVSLGVNVIGTFRIVRASRVIRVLRTISLMPSLRIVIDAIILAFGRAKETVGVLLVIMYVFAVLGLQSFLGGSMTCSDAGPGMFSTGGAEYCQGTYIARGDLCKMANSTDLESLCRNSPEGLELPRIWYSHPWNFDNIGSSMLIVFELLTGENWPTLMHISVGYAGKDMSPVQNYSMWAALYYVAIQMVLNQLLIELFSGVIIDTYLELRANSDNMSLLTDDQKLWVTNMKVMLSSRPVRMIAPPAGSGYILRLRIWLFNIVVEPAFDAIVLLLIILQVLLHSTQYFDGAVSQADSINLASEVLTWIFVGEIVVKVLALGEQFAQDWWNQFDCVVVLGSAISSAISLDETTFISKLFRIVRTLRVLRLLKLSAGLLRLLRALYLALPSLSNVSFILLLIVYIYAVIGINAFSGVRTGWFGYINNDANFNSFGSAYITLIRSMTGENYNGLMHDLMVEPPFCIPYENCGSVWLTVIFFVSFYTITAFMVLNILTAVVMEAYDGCSEESDISSFFESVSGEKQSTYRLTPVAMEQYLVEWNRRDLEGTQFLPKNDLVGLLINLNYPLGLKGDKRLMSTVRSGPGGEDKLEVRQRMQARNIIKKLPLVPRDSDEKYHFHAVLHALMDRASGGSALGAPTDAVRIDGSHKASGLSLLMTDKLVNMQRHLRKKVKQTLTQNSINKQTSHKDIIQSSSSAADQGDTSSSSSSAYSSRKEEEKEGLSQAVSNPLDSNHDDQLIKKRESDSAKNKTNAAAVNHASTLSSPPPPLHVNVRGGNNSSDHRAIKEMPKFKVLKSVPSLIFVEETQDVDNSTSNASLGKKEGDDRVVAAVAAPLPHLQRLESDIDVVERHHEP